MLISPAYRELNAQLHASEPSYGTSGGKWAKPLMEAAKVHDIRSVLDYGAGKSTLRHALPNSYWDRGFILMEYDPAVPGIDAPPIPADLVVCGDVLEHIEPRCILDVLDDIKRCALRFVLFTVATGPAKKVLADGRNAHLLVQPMAWWMTQFEERWEPLNAKQEDKNGFSFFGAAK